MAIKLQHHSFQSSRSSESWLSQSSRSHFYFKKRMADVDHQLVYWGNFPKKCFTRLALLKGGSYTCRCELMQLSEVGFVFHKSARMGHHIPFASSDDGVTVNESAETGTSGYIEAMRVKLDQSLQSKNFNDGLVQSLHDAARIFELVIREQSSLNIAWLSKAWIGVDRNAWVRTVSYQASVYSLLQAATEISSRGNGRDRETNVFVRRRLLRLSSPLEILIRENLTAKQPGVYEWFWSEQVPAVVETFVNYFERNPCYTAATAVKGMSLASGNASDISLLMLTLTCTAAVIKLGPTKVSCPQYLSMIPEFTGRLMDMLVEFTSLRQAFLSMKDIGLYREFLVHLGPQAAACRVKSDCGTDEVVFWVDLVQKQLQQAIDREKIWSRLTTSESIEVLERDLAIFGFFIALGRSTQSFLSANGFDVIDDPIEGFISYLIGGCVLYYPQLSSISSYQLFVEVVSEELDWMPFYPVSMSTLNNSRTYKSRQESSPNFEAIPQVFDVCSHWLQSFIKYSNWLESPSNVKAARFLSRGHNRLVDCMEEMGMLKRKMIENDAQNFVVKTGSGANLPTEREPESFDKALESVEEALVRLEGLLKELHVSSADSGKNHLKAACSDLERIRKLKKEAEFLEASFSAKAASLQQGDDDHCQSSISEHRQVSKGRRRKNTNLIWDGNNSPRGLWSFLGRLSSRKPDSFSPSTVDGTEAKTSEQSVAKMSGIGSELNERSRFENLRKELIELEKRVQKSAVPSENVQDKKAANIGSTCRDETAGSYLVQSQKKENVVGKSFDKLKKASMDVLQGTQLLGVDVVAATGLLRRALIGEELTEKEKKALRRTLSDMASVVPIGILMLLPVTAVGHAAMLAAIQRYVPALIPSTYGAERLDLLRQLEKVKELEAIGVNSNENEGLA